MIEDMEGVGLREEDAGGQDERQMIHCGELEREQLKDEKGLKTTSV